MVVATPIGRIMEAGLTKLATEIEELRIETIIRQIVDLSGSLPQERQAEIIARLQALTQTSKTP